jgi:hypothetical protein
MSKVNQCIKTGARVLLTGESVEVTGDLFFFCEPGSHQHLALHYVEPFKFVQLDKNEPWPMEYDAVFDTETCEGEEFLDIKLAKVMVMHNNHAYVSPNVPVPEGYTSARAVVAAQQHPLEALLASLGKSLGAEVKILKVNGEGKVEE